MFCGAPASSREHVIPKWVGEVLPKGPRARWRHRNEQRTWATNHLDFKVKHVCRECNHGWMEETIEKPAQAALSEMICGQQQLLSVFDCQRIAAWVVKTHAMAQLLHFGESRPLTDELRGALYERHEAPLQSQVWLAAYAGDAAFAAWGRTNHFQLTPGENVSADEVLDGETMTLCIGHLVMQSFKWTRPAAQLGGSFQFNLALPATMLPFLVKIWPQPPQDVAWPPEWALENADSLGEFAKTWTNTGPPPPNP